MTIRPSRVPSRLLAATLAASLSLVFAANAWGNDAERKAMLAKVNKSVVQVRHEQSLGSGFVVYVDGDNAIAATNFHVVDGAKKITIFFPATDREMKDAHEADGYIEIQPERDLALVHFKLQGKKVVPVPIAKELPEQGDTVYTFGSPVGQQNVIAPGMVSSVRTGKEVADLMDRLGKGAYEKGMHYTLDANWIQHTAAMSHGNSGGPLINEKGEAVGINTMNFAPEGSVNSGQQLNYSISTTHLDKLLQSANKTAVRAWSTLPPPRSDHGLAILGDIGKTLDVWKQMNRALNALNTKVAACEEKFKKIPQGNPARPMQGLTGRMKRKGKISEEMAAAYKEYAAKVRAIDTLNADRHVLKIKISESELAQTTANSYHELAMQMANPSDLNISEIMEIKLFELKEITEKMRTERELLRVELTHTYDKEFPTLEETANETASASTDTSKKKHDSGADDDNSSASPGRSAMRTWTDRSGKHHIKAKFLGMEDGKVKLEKPNGDVIRIPPTSLSDEDRQFIGEE
ncbi:MAG: trypsin-like peptidase domain-containing protein [Thermoguttaceae bacterium]